MKYKKGFVDTNIFIEIFVRKGEKSLACARLLKEAPDLWTTGLVVAETEWILRSGYKEPKEKVISCLKQILGSENIKIEDRKIYSEAVGLYESLNIDFTDCINAVFIQKSESPEIYSFDKHFDKYSGIKRLEP